MARVELAPEVADDLDRILDHLRNHDAGNIAARVDAIIEAIDALVHNPLIGRPVEDGKRELVIDRDAYGYVALYRYVPEIDMVLVLAVRGQREGGFTQS